MRTLRILAVMAFAAVFASAQQLEVNTPAGSLTRAGVNPTPGSNFIINTTASMNFRIGGSAASLPYILLTGNLAAVSNSFGGVFGGQFLDLDQPSITVVGDGFGLVPAALPPGYFLLNNNLQSDWTLPVNGAFDGLTIGWQAIVFDASQPFNLNFTAALAFDITSDILFSGDDASATFVFPSGPYTVYGTSHTQCHVSTNGYVKFGGAATSDFSESNTEFINGTPNGVTAGSVAAIMWEDLNMVAGTGVVRIHEDVPNRVTTITWQNGQYFGGVPAGIFGDIVMSITENGGTPLFTYDYTLFSHATPPNEGIVGLSAGMAAVTGTQADVATGGVVNPYASAVNPDTYFQNFDGTGTIPATPFDLGGTIMTIIEAAGALIVF